MKTLFRLFRTLPVGLLFWSWAASAQFAVRQITTNSTDETWGVRNSTTSRGKVLWVDGDDSVVLFDGTTTNVLQTKGTLGFVDDVVFTLGSGATNDSVIAVWRRGTDSGWISLNGAAPVPVTATNPIDPQQPLNAEGVSVADGSVFMVLQAGTSKHVFRMDPVSGYGTNLTGSAAVPGVQGRISSSGAQAVWAFLDNPNDVRRLQFYDSAALQVVEPDVRDSPKISKGRIVYLKQVGALDQVFLHDSTEASPAPLQVTTDAAGINTVPRTDGSHIAWLHTPPGSTNADLMLYGGIQVTTGSNAVPNRLNEFREHPFQLDRGQLLWEDVSNRLQYLAGLGPYALDILPGTNFGGSTGGTPCCVPWLKDGLVAWTGLSALGGTDREVFLLTATPPSDVQRPLPPLFLTALPGPSQVTLSWDRIIGATSYNLYIAYDAALNRDNYHSLAGGMRLSGVSSPTTVAGLTNRLYFFAVSAVADSVEGPTSVPVPVAFWAGVSGAPRTNYFAIAAGLTNGPVAYASGGRAVYETTNGGATWAALAGGIQGLDVRALDVDGARVYAGTRDIFSVGPAQILRSLNSGVSWTAVVSDGGQIGEQNKTIVLDPINPLRIYAADFRLPSMVEPDDSFIIRSSDGGTSWTHLPDPVAPLGAEIRAYSLAINPLNTSVLYAGGSGTPNLVRSSDGGSNWTDVSVGPGFVYGLAIDPAHPQNLVAGAVDSSQVSRGVLRSTNSGANWLASNLGLPATLPRFNTFVIDPLNPQQIYAGTDTGYYFSLDGGVHWLGANTGLSTFGAQSIAGLTLTATRQLLIATGDGLYRLDISGLNLKLPTLTIARTGGTAANVSWPTTTDSSFSLESASSLSASPSWSTVPDAIVVTNGQKRVTVDITNAARFYRLRKE